MQRGVWTKTLSNILSVEKNTLQHLGTFQRGPSIFCTPLLASFVGKIIILRLVYRQNLINCLKGFLVRAENLKLRLFSSVKTCLISEVNNIFFNLLNSLVPAPFFFFISTMTMQCPALKLCQANQTTKQEHGLLTCKASSPQSPDLQWKCIEMYEKSTCRKDLLALMSRTGAG